MGSCEFGMCYAPSTSMYDNKESVLLSREAHYVGMCDCIIAHVTQSPVLVPSPDVGLIIGGSQLQPLISWVVFLI